MDARVATSDPGERQHLFSTCPVDRARYVTVVVSLITGV